MNLSEYQTLSKRTQKAGNSIHETLNNILLGLDGELGEVKDMIKKHEHQGHTLDLHKLLLEFGDVMFYVVWFMSLYGIDADDVLQANVMKLKKRYPTGFEVERSVNRDG